MTDLDRAASDLDDVLQTVENVFDKRIALVTGAVLSTKATLLLDRLDSCEGIAVVGPSGAGKTTALDFLKGAEYNDEELVYWSDDLTPAAFVSHEPSKNEEELAEYDLLPKIRHKSLLNPDMAGWFSGSSEQIRSTMATIARVMDGSGYNRDTGSHGSRGYEGDYRFALIGATTPLDSRAWSAMGHVGNRLVFYCLPRKSSPEEIADDVFGEREYGDQVAECQTEVASFLCSTWEDHGGYGSVKWNSTADGEVREGIAYLAHLVAHCRAPSETGPREGEHRIMSSLRNIARGHAILSGRQKLQLEDVQPVSRIALSTMHKERRGIVRAVLDPDTSNPITSADLRNYPTTESTRKTLRDRMELLESLGLGQQVKNSNGRQTEKFMLKDKFVWPDFLGFPNFK
jgi:energy-coupling factor transporter ATP-binding protein EcfA2